MPEHSQPVLRSLLEKLQQIANTEPKPRVTVHAVSPHGYKDIVKGYVMWNSNNQASLDGTAPIDPTEYVRVMYRSDGYGGYDGFNYVRIGNITRIESTQKHRRTGTYRRLWEPNPFVLTADGGLDMASSLKELLGVA